MKPPQFDVWERLPLKPCDCSIESKERLLRENGELRAEIEVFRQKEAQWASTREELNTTLHELSVHQEELRTQNEDLRAAHHELDQARRRYLDLYDFAPVGYLTLDRYGIIKDLNLTAAGYLGKEKNRLIGKPFVLNVFDTDRENLRAHLRQVFEGYACSTEIRLAGRAMFHALLESAPTHSRNGEVEECRSAVLDISERKRAEEARAASEQKYRSLVEQMNEGLILCRVIESKEGEIEDWVVRDVNAAMEALTGVSREMARGKSLHQVYGALFRAEVSRDAFHSVVRTGEPMRFAGSFPTIQKDLSFSMFCPSPGMVAVVITDITEQKRAEEARMWRLATLRRKIELTARILAETSREGILRQTIEAAREVTRARLGAALHGLGDSGPMVQASTVEDTGPCPPEGVLTEELAREYLDAMDWGGCLRMNGGGPRGDPLFRHLAGVGPPVQGVLAVPLLDRKGFHSGILVVCDKEEGEFDIEEEGVLKQLAALASLGLQHVSARVKAEQRAEELDAVFSALTDAVFITRPDGTIDSANSSALALCGFDPVGRKVEEILEELGVPAGLRDAASSEALPCIQALRGEVGSARRLRLRSPDGRELIVFESACPTRMHGGTTGVVMAWHDVTERENLLKEVLSQREALRQANDELDRRVSERTDELARTNRSLQREVEARRVAEQGLIRSNESLQHFAFIASHDLQEPLRKINSFGERLERSLSGRLTEESGDYLERMKKATRRMQDFIDGLLTYSRVSTQKEPFRQVDLNKVIRSVLSDLEDSIQQTGCRVELGELPTIEADSIQMRQLCQNLISNAIKFHGDAPPIVKIYAEFPALSDDAGAPAVRRYRLFFQDNGIGFEEACKDKIFNLFERLHGRCAYVGTGLGLAICRRIVERHGGRITATSKPGEGATFIVTLPEKQSDHSGL